MKKSCKNIFKTNLYGDEYFTQSIDNLNYNYNSIVDDKQFDKHNKNSSLNYIEDYISENKKIKNDIQKEKIEIPNEDATRISENLKENSNLDIISQSILILIKVIHVLVIFLTRQQSISLMNL